MKLALPIGILLVTVAAGAVAVAVWASVADAPWEDNGGNGSLLCEDALERRKAVEDALQRPVSQAVFSGRPTEPVVGQNEGPLSAFRDDPLFSDEVMRLESTLRDIERDIERFCE